MYPGGVKMVVELANGVPLCPDVTPSDTSCTVYFPRDIYNISITQSNDIGPTVNSGLFDGEYSGTSAQGTLGGKKLSLVERLPYLRSKIIHYIINMGRNKSPL